MAADGEIVDVEGPVAVDEIVGAGLHHIAVPLGPGGLIPLHLQFQTGLILPPVIAQVGVGGQAAIHIIVAVVAQGEIAHPPQLLGQGEGQAGPQLAGAFHGDGVSVFRVKPQQGLALPVGGAGIVQGGVIIGKHKALGRQFI